MSKEKSASQILKNRARSRPGSAFVRLVKWSLLIAFVLTLMGTTAMLGIYFYLSDDLPKITSLADYWGKEKSDSTFTIA